jgi:sec-independent protein translocase protein TatA
MGELSPWHLLILAGVFVLLFGAKRLPDGARSLGRSLRIFKTEVKGLNDDDEAQQQTPPQLPPAPASPAPAPTAGPTTETTTAPPSAVPPTVTGADAAQHQHETR